MIGKRDQARGPTRDGQGSTGDTDGLDGVLDEEARVSAIAAEQQSKDVLSSLRGLGFKLDGARRETEYTASMESVTLE